MERTNTRIQALEGKDVKDLLLNVGSGGGAAAAAPAAGGAAAGGAAAEEAPAEEKAEGKDSRETDEQKESAQANRINREGGVRRRHGFRSIRLSARFQVFLSVFDAWPGFFVVLRCKGMAGLALLT